ncbi:MAG TPA: HAD family phosphatase [Propionibacteriaceae bacterium]|jgi:putative hydrolase of the HAD superfamily
MSITIPNKVVLFDYGEVISVAPSETDRAHIADLAGGDSTALWESYWRHRDALDLGALTVRDYWRQIEQDLYACWDTALLHRLWLADFRSWLAVDQGTLDVLIDLQRGGTRMALLSNAGPDFASYYRHGLLGDFFERVFVSGELGMIKPGPDIFRAVLDGLAVPPHDVLFIDNREANVRGAEAVGIPGHVYTDSAELRAFLGTLAV